MTLAIDAAFMMMNGPEPAERVTYEPHQGVAKDIYILVTREQVAAEFSGGLEVPVLEYGGFLVNDAVQGVVCVQDGKDRIHVKAHLHDQHPSVFRVVSHTTDAGAHTIRMRL